MTDEQMDDRRGERFERTDLSGAVFRDVDLSGAAFVDAVMIGVRISGLVQGMTINDVEVAPLVEAELDRRHPERLALRPTDAAGARAGWQVVHDLWAPTIGLARSLAPELHHARVDDEWSLVETLQHLLFVTDAWFTWAVRGEFGFHAMGLVPAFLDDEVDRLGIDRHAEPSLDDVLARRVSQHADVARWLADADDRTLAAARLGNDDRGYPPPSTHSALQCLRVVMDEEWNHHRYAVRDLSVLLAA